MDRARSHLQLCVCLKAFWVEFANISSFPEIPTLEKSLKIAIGTPSNLVFSRPSRFNLQQTEFYNFAERVLARNH